MDENVIYILCPANAATGGPEALHQLGRELINSDYNVFMHYYDYDILKNNNPVHPNYSKYNVPFAVDVLNTQNSILIFPETVCMYLWSDNYSQTRKIIWWLSVTNFFISLGHVTDYYKKEPFYFIKKLYKNFPIPTLRKVKKSPVLHLAHSHFSVDFLKKKNIPIIGQISDFMNEEFLNVNDYSSLKEDIVIYNPVKNDVFLDKIIAKTKKINWVPIQNMTPEEVSEKMKKAKVYIDFGYHPGKERMPRESCLMDCCLLIGKNGSAKFKEDMPILDEYHFDISDENIDAIILKINDCLVNYEANILNFINYKKVLLDEKKVFSKDVKKVFSNLYEKF